MVNPLYTIASSETFAAEKQAATPVSTPPAAPARVPQPSSDSGVIDRVTLSAGARAHLLLTQGQSIEQIAVDLSTTATTVDSYLGIITPPRASSHFSLSAVA